MQEINQSEEVIKTMLIPLWARALEQTKVSPILIDRYALSMLKALGYGLDYYDAKEQKNSQLGCCIRGLWVDNEVRSFAKEQGQPIQVIQLGAGLDARFERLQDVEGISRWYDLDLPEAMAIRQSVIPQNDKVKCLALSLFDEAWMKCLAKNNLPTLIILEGVLMYFSKEEIAGLMASIYQHLPHAVILFDSVGYKLVGQAKRHDALSKQKQKVEFTWGSKSKEDIEALHPKIRVDKYLFMHRQKGSEHFPLPMRLFVGIPFLHRRFMQRLIRVSFREG